MTKTDRAFDGCRILEWDSEHFGMRLARVVVDRVSEEQWPEIFSWCAHQAVRGLYYLCPAGEQESARAAMRAGFEWVDIRVEMEWVAGASVEMPPAMGIRRATENDVEELKKIAAKSHYDTRFYADAHFPRAACDRLYEIWIEKSCRHPKGVVWTADAPDGKLVGYVACEIESDHVGRIGLVAVREDWRGRGWGAALMRSALAWFSENGCSRARVATQGANRAALRLYGKCGFSPVQIGLWFHKWFLDAP